MELQVESYLDIEILTYKISYIVLIVSAVLSFIYWIFHNKVLKDTGKILFVLALIILSVSIFFRYLHIGRLPFIHTEVYILLGWLMLVAALFGDKTVKNNFPSTFTAMFVGATLLYFDGQYTQEAGGVPPALQSNWLGFHVATTMFGYAAFSIAFLAAVAYLVNKIEWLEELSYKMTALGFPFLTIGIISGAIWAQSAWGTWWGWDPKETASLIMWLIYAAYHHLRLTAGWKGSKAAWMNLVGFASMIFCFLGLNLVSAYFEGMGSKHVYGEGTTRMQNFIFMILAIAVIVVIGSLIMRFRQRAAKKDKPQLEDD